MSGLLDTSVIVRYLTGDPPDLADISAAIIDSTEQLYISHVVMAETAYVLLSYYGLGRAAVVDALVALLQRENLAPSRGPKATMIEALLLCRPSARVSFTDALTWAEAHSSTHRTVYSLDRRFPRDGIDLRQAVS